MAGHAHFCHVSGKRRFRDHRHAVRALHGAARCRRAAVLDGVVTSRRECRSYLCDWCDGWHLTSQKEWGIVTA